VEPFLTAARREILRALAPAFVPEVEAASAVQWAALEATIAHAVAQRPPGVRRQLAWFLRLLVMAGYVRFGRPLTRIRLADRNRFLERLSRSPLLPVRRGVWGLRTLVMMGWYTQPEVIRAMGYRARPEGWSAR
jgi:hypothetical protein